MTSVLDVVETDGVLFLLSINDCQALQSLGDCRSFLKSISDHRIFTNIDLKFEKFVVGTMRSYFSGVPNERPKDRQGFAPAGS